MEGLIQGTSFRSLSIRRHVKSSLGCVHVLLHIYILFEIFLDIISVIEISRTQIAVIMTAEDNKNRSFKQRYCTSITTF
jgi:hypothetical protein